MEPINHPIDDAALDRYLAGESDPAEAERVERWLAAEPRRAAVAAELRRDTAAAGAAWNVDAAWTRMEAAMHDELGARRRLAASPAARRAWAPGRALRIAAGVVLVAGAGVLASRIVRDRAPEAVSFETRRGERRQVTLDDGTVVVLAAASHLRYTSGSGGRDAELDGEALFRVRHSAARPFTVRARNAVARDLGTEFTVRAYAGEPAVNVAVSHGSVSLAARSGGAPGVLRAGDVGSVAADGSVRLAAGAGAERWTGWVDGRLTFEAERLDAVAAELSRWYDADVRIADPALAARRVTAVYASPSIEQVLDALSAATGSRWERSGSAYVLSAPAR